MVTMAAVQQAFNIDAAKTRTIERLVRPLIEDITAIVNPRPLQPGQSVEVIAAAVERTTEHFIEVAEGAIRESSAIASDHALSQLHEALSDVRSFGTEMAYASREFIKDTSSTPRRSKAVQAGRALLLAIARLLIMADQIDVQLILHHAHDQLDALRDSESNQEIVERYETLLTVIEEVDETTRRRIKELRSLDEQDDLRAARALLKTHAPILFAASKAYLRHGDSDACRLNRDYAEGELAKALASIARVLEGREAPQNALSRLAAIGDLARELDEFQQRVYMEPSAYRDNVHRRVLEERLERIVSGSAAIADSASTRGDRKQRIVQECNNLRQALQDLLKQYELNCHKKEPSEEVDLAMVNVSRKAKDLRRHLRRAIVDHVSDAFLDTRTPILILIDAAKRGDEEATHHAGRIFLAHADKLVEVSHLVCQMCSDSEGVRVIRYAASQVHNLAPQVVHAAHFLCSNKDSRLAQENMDAFREIWQEKVRLLTLAVDSAISLDDFLAVSEAHIVEDTMTGLEAVYAGDGDLLDRTAGAIRGRSLRVCDVVDEEIAALPGVYSDRVKVATRKLRNDVLSQFSSRAERVVATLLDGEGETNQEQNSDEFINACTLVHNAVKEVRNALLVNRNPEDVDSDNEYEEDGVTVAQDSRSQVSDGENAQRLMRRLPEEDKRKIQEQIDVFKLTQSKFEREVAKWDETGNDLIVLAKHMCHIMMNMMDFTRGRGPLKTTMDVIHAAQEISDAGAKLNALARQIGDESTESTTKQDLFAYLARIVLYCQQLNICSRVKADVTQVGNELKVSGGESAMSLIQTAKNLLNAVVLTVKAAYIASTKYRRPNTTAARVVEWRMAPPQKQPLVRVASSRQGVIRRASERRVMPPMEALAQFHR